MNNKKQITLFIPIVFLLVAILITDLPYGYYTLLRFIVCLSALYHVWLIKDDNKNLLSAIFIIIAILFNPIMPIELPKQVWLYIDKTIATAYLVYFLASSFNSMSLLKIYDWFSSMRFLKIYDWILNNKRIFALIITVVLLIVVLFNRWEVWSDGKFSYHRDLLTSITFIKLEGSLVGTASLPKNAIAISNAVTFIMYALIGATCIVLFNEVRKKRQNP